MKTFFERLLTLKFRRKRRYKAKNGLFAVPENQLNRNQIGDIILGGLSFYYVDNGQRAKKNDYTLTLMADGKSNLVQVACRTVSESEAGEFVYQNQRILRRGVRFMKLSLQQKRQIRRLIKEHTEGKPNPGLGGSLNSGRF